RIGLVAGEGRQFGDERMIAIHLQHERRGLIVATHEAKDALHIGLLLAVGRDKPYRAILQHLRRPHLADASAEGGDATADEPIEIWLRRDGSCVILLLGCRWKLRSGIGRAAE